MLSRASGVRDSATGRPLRLKDIGDVLLTSKGRSRGEGRQRGKVIQFLSVRGQCCANW